MTTLLPTTLLLAGDAVLASLGAERTLALLAEGVEAAEAPEPEIWPLQRAMGDGVAALRAALDVTRFDERMRAARALVVCERSLAPATLSDSVTFELATRARQAGVPTYSVVRTSRLGPFEERMLDIESILLARDERSLRAAGGALAALL